MDGFIKSMRNIAEEYFNADSLDKKKKIKYKFDSLQSRIINENDFLTSDDKKKFLSWNPFENKSTDFFDSEIQFGTKFFDIVIMNPPYVRIYRDRIDENMVGYLKNNYLSAFKKFDLYVCFIEKSLKLLSNFGVSCFIVPDKWLSQPYGQKLRNYILENFNILNICDLTNMKVFTQAVVDNIICIIDNNKNSNGIIKLKKFNELKNINNCDKFEILQSNLKLNAPINLYMFTDNKISEIINIIDKYSIKLSNICYVNWGCRPTPQEKFIASKKINEKYKPLIVGSNISRYFVSKNYRWVKYVKEMYNPLFKELFENKTIVFKDIIGKGSITASLNYENYYSDFTVINAIKWELLSELNLKQVKMPKDYNLYEKYNILYVLGISNSKLVSFYFDKTMKNGLHTLPNGVKNLPIPKINFSNKSQKNSHNEIVSLVENIIKNKAKGNDTEKEEKEINEIVYKLYDLNEEEIKIIEEK